MTVFIGQEADFTRKLADRDCRGRPGLNQALAQPVGKGSPLPALHRAGAPAQVVAVGAGDVAAKNRIVVQPDQ